ncbi:OmpA family protein [Devosia sp. 2618]|uniref:OmpA family protein n=1 Tax=Devosia sp. 2618 TaxID=3156454 RepID=UPI0033996F4E
MIRTLSLALLMLATPAVAQDHPLVGHFEGSTQLGYQEAEFDEVHLITGPIEDNREQSGQGWDTLEGKVYTIYYRLPTGRSSLEALRTFQLGLEQRGFDTAFVCSAEAGDCFADKRGRPGLMFGLALDGRTSMPRFDIGEPVANKFYNGNARYLLAKQNAANGAIYASLAFSDDESLGRHLFLRVVETGEIAIGALAMMQVSELSQKLRSDGKVDIYGIQFDFDSAAIRSDSSPQIRVIAELLNETPELGLVIVGHTDTQGTAAYNRDLSQRRAQAVLSALVSQHGIADDRLIAEGRGFSEPVASNDDEVGRALNRRVELVQR